MGANRRVLVIATGGTIASVQRADGLAPGLTGKELLQYVPQVSDVAQVTVTQPMNIDSTNMRPRDWLCIKDVIRASYDDYDGFVVLHGTDTMAYTAAALSYLIQGGRRPIVLTGAQQPMASPFTDARLNLYQSVVYAADPRSRGVSVVFGGSVIVGTRARKQRTLSYNAFTSVNYPLPAVIRGSRIVRDAGTGMGIAGAGDETGRAPLSPTFYDRLDERVVVLRLTPELQPSILGLLRSDYRAVILETFGIGGIPNWDDHAWRDAIYAWVASGRILVVTTQVPEEGLDLGVYEVGRAFANHPGILRGDDMTTEALVAKTMWALGQTDDASELARLFYQPVNHDRAEG